MKNNLKVKTLHTTVSGSQTHVFIEEVNQLFTGKKLNLPKNIVYNEKYFQSIFKLNNLKDSSNIFKHYNETSAANKKLEKSKLVQEGKRYNYVFYDESSLSIINFLFSAVIIGLLDGLIGYGYKAISQLVILTCSSSSTKDIENCLEIYKNFNSEFNFTQLEYLSHVDVLEDKDFKRQKSLASSKELEIQVEGKRQKIGKFYLVIFDRAVKPNESVLHKYEKLMEREGIPFFVIRKDNMKEAYIRILIEILKDSFDVNDESLLYRMLNKKMFEIKY